MNNIILMRLSQQTESSTENFDQYFTRMEITSEDESTLSSDGTESSLFEDFDFVASSDSV